MLYDDGTVEYHDGGEDPNKPSFSGTWELDEETGLMLSPAIRVSDMDAPLEGWIKQIEDTITTITNTVTATTAGYTTAPT